ncbi:50S ribosomal protein L25 [Patescibacteria group bacterium]|nr:MAG: 50S ribosomal protein L25 [Patescibacteria group bacterium]
MTLELKATKRTVSGKGVQVLRDAGLMPAVMYGPKNDPISIEVPVKDFQKIFKAAGESSVISLSVDGAEQNVLINAVDRDPVSNIPRHADFYAVQKGQKVAVYVPIEFVGIAPAVKELNGNLVKALHEIEIEAEATNLPHSISVDISTLDSLDKQILAGDVVLPTGVSLVTGVEEVVALVSAAREEEETPVTAPDMSTIGISEERGKKEEEALPEEE